MKFASYSDLMKYHDMLNNRKEALNGQSFSRKSKSDYDKELTLILLENNKEGLGRWFSCQITHDCLSLGKALGQNASLHSRMRSMRTLFSHPKHGLADSIIEGISLLP
jgi:hypothetical protein